MDNQQNFRVEYHTNGVSTARYGESFASHYLKMVADRQLAASTGRSFQSGIIRG